MKKNILMKNNNQTATFDYDKMAKKALTLLTKAIFVILITSLFAKSPETIRQNCGKLVVIDILAIYYFRKVRKAANITYLDILKGVGDFLKDLVSLVIRLFID